MWRAVTLAIGILGLFAVPVWAGTHVFVPRPPHDAPAAAFTSSEVAFKAFLAAHCKIQEAMGKTSPTEANDLITAAVQDLKNADRGFGEVAAGVNKNSLNIPQTIESKDAKAEISGQSYPAPANFSILFSTMQTSVQNEVKELEGVKFTDSDASNVPVAVHVNTVRIRTERIYIAVSVLTTLATQ
jgi:hypothetical protein